MGQRDVLASERMSNVIPMFVFPVVQSTSSFYRLHQFHKFVRLTKPHFSRGNNGHLPVKITRKLTRTLDDLSKVCKNGSIRRGEFKVDSQILSFFHLLLVTKVLNNIDNSCSSEHMGSRPFHVRAL